MMETNHFKHAAKRGAQYLTSIQQNDGCIGSSYILDHYKAPWALINTGHLHEAQMLLNWIGEHSCTKPGQFHNGDSLLQVLRSSTYRNVFIMIAALKLGDFTIYNKYALKDLCSYQHKNLGSFYGEENFDDSVLLNTNHSAMAGLFCLMSGMTKRATMVGDFILNHLNQQPLMQEKFYIHTNTKGQLITEFSNKDAFWYTIDYSQSRGHYWAIGTGAYFLTELFLFSKQKRFLEGARQLLNICKLFSKGFETWPSSGKVAWAAAKLYSVTREECLLNLAHLVGYGCLLESQKEDGSWGPFAFNMGQNNGYHLSIAELTAEFTLLCSSISQALI